MSSPPPQVAFSLAAPLAQVVRETRRRPLATLVPVLVLLLPLVPLVLGIEYVLAEGGSSALQGLIGGAPEGRPGTLILRPDTRGWLLLAALGALLVAVVAVILASGLVAGAATAEEPRARLRHTLPRALAVWPAMLVLIAVQLVVVGVLAAAVGLAAYYAGQEIQWQLPTPVSVVGLALLLILMVRLSLWPAAALAEGLGPFRAMRRSWVVTRGSVSRVLGAGLAALLLIFVPALILRAVVKFVLTALAWQEVIDLSPLAIDLWGFAPFPIAIFLLSAFWGREAPLLHAALRTWPPAPVDPDAPAEPAPAPAV